MTAPETLEELRRAVRDVLATTTPDPDGKAQTAESALHEIAALLPPAPEPIKVGDRVRAEHDSSFEGDVLGGPWDDNGDPTVCVGWDNAMGLELMVVTDLSRVNSSPSPEPERKVEDVIAAASAAGVIGAGLHPAPSPSPEVPEGWRVPVDRDEVAAARRAGVLRYDYPPESSQPTGWGPIWRPGTRKLRVPSGWAEGRELVPVPKQPDVGEGYRWLATAEALEEALRTPGVAVSYTNDRLDGRWDVMDDDTAAIEGAGARGGGLTYWCQRWILGHTWRASDPLPNQETRPAEPHESEDPEELAAAVAAGLLVEVSYRCRAWRPTDNESVDDFAHDIERCFRYRIHGTVPGYGETGGAS